MKNLLLFIFLSFFASVGTTHTATAQTAKTAVHTPENEGWLLNLEEAFKESKETGKPIMANFTGSDWCGWCKKLTKSVFVHKEFKDWADKNVVLLELDYPRRKQLPADLQEQNRGLQQAFRVSGYPTVWVFYLDKDDAGQFNIDPLGKTGYSKTVGEFTTGVDQMIAKRKKAE